MLLLDPMLWQCLVFLWCFFIGSGSLPQNRAKQDGESVQADNTQLVRKRNV